MTPVHAPNMRGDGLTWEQVSALPRWVNWQSTTRNGETTKLPYKPFGTKSLAKSDDPKDWAARDQATSHTSAISAEGIGVMFGQIDATDWALGGIDLDSCRDPISGAIEPWAIDLIRRFKTYTEISPSKTGVKLYFQYNVSYRPSLIAVMGGAEHGKQFKRDTGIKHGPAIEVYFSNRYFAVTGEALEGCPVEIHRAFLDDLLYLIQVGGPAFAGKAPPSPQPLLEARAAVAPVTAQPPSTDLWERINRSSNWHATLKRLLDGDFSSLMDRSRSGLAMALGSALSRAQYSFDETVQALQTWPHTSEWARDKADTDGGRQYRRIWEKATEPRQNEEPPTTIEIDGQEYELNEDGLAEAFTRKFRDRLRYCHTSASWYVWSAASWEKQDTKLAFSWARQLGRELSKDAKPAVRDRVAKAATAAAIERYAQADERVAVTSTIWDRDPFLLGTPKGTVDLTTGVLREPDPADHITKLAAVAPADEAICPLWDAFLKEATNNDPELILFLQQFCGYLLTGDTREHALLFIYGPGGNGKSVWLNTISGILAQYGRNAAMETFTASASDRHPTDLAMLKGARMVCSSETEEGRAWAETRIKQLTGGDVISARFMRQDFFEFRPEFKLVVIGNHKPVLRNVDEAARRRFNIIPFIHRPTKPDRELEKKLRDEWPAILRWAINGCLLWQRDGLSRPSVVTAATDEYFAEQDMVKQWMDDFCIVTPKVSDTAANVFKSWSDFALANGEKPNTAKWLSQNLIRHGIWSIKNTPGQNGKRGYQGIEVKHVDTSNQWQNRDEF